MRHLNRREIASFVPEARHLPNYILKLALHKMQARDTRYQLQDRYEGREGSKRWGSEITFLKSFWICVWRACIFLNIARFFASSFAESLVWRLIDLSDCEAACTASNALFTCPSPLRTDCGASAFYGCRTKGKERKSERQCSGEEEQEAARLRREGRG